MQFTRFPYVSRFLYRTNCAERVVFAGFLNYRRSCSRGPPRHGLDQMPTERLIGSHRSITVRRSAVNVFFIRFS